jgi:2-dehydropantoate 2-reductase
MRVLVLGTGATGGYFGGRLAAAGRDVTFLVRPERAARLARDGLVIVSPVGDLRLAPRTTTAVTEPYDLILLGCKAYDLESAIAAVAPAVGSQSTVVPMLNGMRHLDRLDAAFGADRVLGGVVYIGATLGPEGEIRHLNDVHGMTFGERSGARSERCAAIAACLAPANFKSVWSDTILQDMWEKFVMLASLAAMSCLMRSPVGRIVAAAEGEALMTEMLGECCAVAADAGFPYRPEPLAATRAMLTRRGSPFSASMLRDIERGGPVEAEHIVGDLLHRARAAGRAAPLLRVAYCHLQAYEAGRAGPS